MVSVEEDDIRDIEQSGQCHLQEYKIQNKTWYVYQVDEHALADRRVAASWIFSRSCYV